MRRVPILPTIVAAAAVALMIGLGVWQLHRAAWKEALLAEYARAAALPPVDLDPLLASGRPLPALSFRRALVTCAARDVAPDARAGRSAADVPGQAYYLPCRPGAAGIAGRLRINAGWGDRPDLAPRLTLTGIVAGRLSQVGEDGPITLVSATPVPPLALSQAPSTETIPNNHLMYAWQWFFFALTAAVIYVLALRKRNKAVSRHPGDGRDPSED